ncbi:Cullin repeat-like-containing domain protein [Mrakia frigida]|uniref:Cullin repeat-like-containing domain protein n=1 Tax=Mrakia frigida TaxID=29902 RepID=UPI003FCC06A2
MEAIQQAPPPTATLEEAWEYLNEGMDAIMGDCSSDDPNPSMSYLYYMALYGTSYNFCTSSRLPAGDAIARRGGGRTSAMTENPGAAHLYSKITTYFEDYARQLASVSSSLPSSLSPIHRHHPFLQKLTLLVSLFGSPSQKLPTSPSLTDLPLLQLYAKVWSNFFARVSYVTRLFTYLNRSWISQQNRGSERKLLETQGLALKAFKEIYFSQTQASPDHRLTDAVLRMVTKGGDEMDSTLVEQIVASFVTPHPEWEAKDVSGEDPVYADAFVSATKAFFKTEEDRKLARKYLGRKEY